MNAARGLTLIELMVVVAIIAVLGAVAFPAYQEQIRKGRRAEGQAVLLEAAQFMERWVTENQRYDQNVAGTAVALPSYLAQAPKEGSAKFYNLSLQAVAQNSFTLQAVPFGAMTGDACGTLTVNATGTKGSSRADCWRR